MTPGLGKVWGGFCMLTWMMGWILVVRSPRERLNLPHRPRNKVCVALALFGSYALPLTCP